MSCYYFHSHIWWKDGLTRSSSSSDLHWECLYSGGIHEYPYPDLRLEDVFEHPQSHLSLRVTSPKFSQQTNKMGHLLMPPILFFHMLSIQSNVCKWPKLLDAFWDWVNDRDWSSDCTDRIFPPPKLRQVLLDSVWDTRHTFKWLVYVMCVETLLHSK